MLWSFLIWLIAICATLAALKTTQKLQLAQNVVVGVVMGVPQFIHLTSLFCCIRHKGWKGA